MIAVLQRLSRGSVVIDGSEVASAGRGLLILLGVADGDGQLDADLLAEKIAKLRIFEDENGKMNLSVNDVGGSAIVVSNFTLLANYKHGNRPDFLSAAKPPVSEPLYEYFKSKLQTLIPSVSSGVFGADMQVSITNDGPITIVMDSNVLKAGNK